MLNAKKQSNILQSKNIKNQTKSVTLKYIALLFCIEHSDSTVLWIVIIAPVLLSTLEHVLFDIGNHGQVYFKLLNEKHSTTNKEAVLKKSNGKSREGYKKNEVESVLL